LFLCLGNPFVRRGSALAAALLCVALYGAPADAQGRRGEGARATGAPASTAESDPITCWWRTDKDSVRVGEPFTLALTCNVADTSTTQVVVDPARLDPAGLEMMPFEVLGGQHPQDIPTPPSRSFQYSYTLRLLGDEFFGKDVDIPALPLTYRVQSRESNATQGQGRDQVYLLPALPMRVLSLVPGTATDIHDTPGEMFADIESLSARSHIELAIAGMLFVCAGAFAVVALVRVSRRAHDGHPESARLLPVHIVVRACERELQRVKAEAATGWTPELIGRALAVFRIAGAVAVGRPVAQTSDKAGQSPRPGQLVVQTGPPWKPARVLLSASTTAATIAGELGTQSRTIDSSRRETLEDLGAPLQQLIAAHYGRDGGIETDALENAVDRGIRGLQRLQSATRWPGRATGPLARAAAMVREATWAR
jgi:hypothetical protein